MAVRCKWFDDDGEPILGGCKTKGRPCSYVHPDDVRWRGAERRQSALDYVDGNSRRKTTAHASTPPALSHRRTQLRKGSSSFSHHEKRAEFDEDSWNAGPSRGTAAFPSRPTSWQLPSHPTTSNDRGWGASVASVGAASAAETTSGWGVAISVGWGSGTQDSQWGVESGNTWANQSLPETKTAAPPPTASLDMLKPLPDRNTGAVSRSKNASVESNNRNPPPRDSHDGSFSYESKGKERTYNRPPPISIITNPLTPQASAGAYGSITSSTPMLTPITPLAPPPLPSASSRAIIMPPPPVSASSATAEPKELLAEARAMKQKEGYKDEIKAKISIMQAGLSPEERMSVYRKVIKGIQCLVGLQVRLNKLRATEENWKRNQNSPFYAKSTQRAREKLEAGRRDTGKRMQDLKRQRDVALADLISLPDIPTRSHRPYNVALDRQKLMDYTLELKSWFEDLDLPRRLATRQAQDNAPDAMAIDYIPSSKDVPASPSPVTILRERKHISAKDIHSTIETLQQRITAAEESAYFSMYLVSDVDAATREVRNAIQKKRRQKISAAMDVQKQQLDDVDGMIREKANATLGVHDRIKALEVTLDNLKEKTAGINKSNEELEILIQQSELKQKERTQVIEELSVQLRTIIANRRSPSAPRPVRDITIDDIDSELRQALVDQLTRELQPVLEGLVEGTRLAGEGVRAVVEEMVEPIVQKTAEISGRVWSLPVPPS